MSVSLGYTSVKPVSPTAHEQLLSLAAEANQARQWWCEPIWISPAPNPSGNAFGSTKLFCDIADEDIDTYMALLDGDEIVKFLTMIANRLAIEWRMEFEGMPIGGVTKAGPDEELQAHTKMFLEMFPGNFEVLKTKTQEEILTEWGNRKTT